MLSIYLHLSLGHKHRNRPQDIHGEMYRQNVFVYCALIIYRRIPDMTSQAPAQVDMSTPHEMKVLKRNLSTECISFDKVTKRIRSLSHNLCVDPTKVSQKVIEALFDGVSTRQIDELAAQISASMSLEHPHYNDLAGRIAVSNHQKNTTNSFFKTMKMLYEATDINGEHHPIISKDLYKLATNHKKEIEETIDYERDYLYDYFGFKTLEKSYLMRLKGQPVERIQHMWMRVSLAIHQDDLAAAFETYHLMSSKMFTHATPTLFNAGTPRPQLSSCFLLEMKGDSVPEIFQTLEQCAQISKWAGGIGLHVHNIRAKGSYIRGTNGVSNGLVPMLKCYNSCARYVDQCLVSGDVFTVNGLKDISTVMPSDMVLGSDGNFHCVKNVLQHAYDGEIIEVNMSNGATISVTPVQQICIRRPVIGGDVSDLGYIDSQDLLPADQTSHVQSKYHQDVESWSSADCWVLGLLLNTPQLEGFAVSLHEASDGDIRRLKTYLDDRLIPYYERAKDEQVCITWQPSNMFPFTTHAIVDGVPLAALHLPGEKAASIRSSLYRDVKNIEYLKYRCSACLPWTVKQTRVKHMQAFVYDLDLQGSDAYMTTAGLLHQAEYQS